MKVFALSALLCCLLLSESFAWQETIKPETIKPETITPDQREENYNLQLATLGGTQFWTDLRVVGQWRVQRNSYFGHCRLLDHENERQAWGSEQECSKVLDQKIADGIVHPYKGKVVILLHGLVRTWKSMEPMAVHLRKQGYQCVLFRYASSRNDVGTHSLCLRRVIEGLGPEVTEINFVAHSLGNIVIRHYVGDCQRDPVRVVNPAIHRMVMIGPPNQGSRMARLLSNTLAFKVVAGAAGLQLSGDWKSLESKLATPEFEFGIIAGGLGDGTPNNILLPGKDDFTVAVDETRLVGARDFYVDQLFHSTMMAQPSVLERTTRFLKHGYFISKDDRRPLVADSALKPTHSPKASVERR